MAEVYYTIHLVSGRCSNPLVPADDLCRRNGTISGLPTIHGPNPLPRLAMIPDLGG